MIRSFSSTKAAPNPEDDLKVGYVIDASPEQGIFNN
jgi:hypothetical protein